MHILLPSARGAEAVVRVTVRRADGRRLIAIRPAPKETRVWPPPAERSFDDGGRFEGDRCRLANEGSNRTFPDINISEGHHKLSHHQNKKTSLDKIAEIDRWYVRQFSRFLEKLDAAKDIDGKSLLHNSMVVYGRGNGDGNRHSYNNLALILAGSGGGTLAAGRHVKFKARPMTDMYLSMLDRMGVDGVQRLGDSTGRMQGI